MGGHIAFEVLRQNPEKVMGLFLCNTSADVESEAGKQKRLEFAKAPHSVGEFQGVTRSEWPRFVGNKDATNSEMLESTQQMARKLGLRRAQQQAFALANRPSSHQTLTQAATNKLPISVCLGIQDQIVLSSASEAMALSAGVEDSDIERLDTGHLGPWEDTVGVAKALTKLVRQSVLS